MIKAEEVGALGMCGQLQPEEGKGTWEASQR